MFFNLDAKKTYFIETTKLQWTRYNEKLPCGNHEGHNNNEKIKINNHFDRNLLDGRIYLKENYTHAKWTNELIATDKNNNNFHCFKQWN